MIQRSIWSTFGLEFVILTSHNPELGFPGGSGSKESSCNEEYLGLIPGLGRSPGGGHGTHCSILAWSIPMNIETWWATVHGVTESDTTEQPSTAHTTLNCSLSWDPRKRHLILTSAGCCCSVTPSRLILCDPMKCSQASPSFTISWSLLNHITIESVMPSSYLVLCFPLLLLPSIFPRIRVFPNESVLSIRWPKYGASASASVLPYSNWYSGLISFAIDWFDFLAVQGTHKSLLQHHSSKASILWHSAFFTVQLSHTYMTTGKTIALTRWTFVGRVGLCFLVCCLGLS